MKKTILVFLFAFLSVVTYAQTNAIKSFPKIPGNPQDTSSILITFTNGGIDSTYRMTWHQLDSLISSSSSGWSLTGNSGTDPSTNFVGTTDLTNLILKTNSDDNYKMELTTDGFLRTSNVNNNTGIGHNVGFSPPCAQNTSLGDGALENGRNAASGINQNTGVGYNALLSIADVSQENTGVGANSLTLMTSGVHNTDIGANSLNHDTSGSNNTAVGRGSCQSNYSGNNITAIGYQTDVMADGFNNATAIGASTVVGCSNCGALGDSTQPFQWGIGYSTPSAYLNGNNGLAINGKIALIDGTQGNGFVLTSDAKGLGSWQAPSGGGTSWLLTGNSGTSGGTNFIGTKDTASFIIATKDTARIVIDSIGQVGIGRVPFKPFQISNGTNINNFFLTSVDSITWSDVFQDNDLNFQSVFHKSAVSDDVTFTTGTGFSGFSSAYNVFQIVNNDTSDNAGLNVITNSVSSLVIDKFGKTGLGTLIPVEKLEVNGNTLIDTNLYVNGNVGIGTTTPTNSLTINSNISNITYVQTDNSPGLNDATYSGTIIYPSFPNVVVFTVTIEFAGSPDVFSWTETGASNASGSSVAIDGTAQSLADGISIQFGATTGHSFGDQWVYTISPAVISPLAVYINGATAMKVDSNGNTGIGVAIPVEALDVNGNIRLEQLSSSIPVGIKTNNISSFFYNQFNDNIYIGNEPSDALFMNHGINMGLNAGFNSNQNQIVSIGEDAGYNCNSPQSVYVGEHSGNNPYGFPTSQSSDFGWESGDSPNGDISGSTNIGFQSGEFCIGQNNTYTGASSGYLSVSNNSVATGYSCLTFDTADFVIGMGFNAGNYSNNGNKISNSLYIDYENVSDSSCAIFGTIHKIKINKSLQINDGTQGTGKVLTSAANGLASWQPPNSSLTALNGTSGTPSIAAGAGAGTSPSVSVSGTNIGGLVTVTTGAIGVTTGIVATITYNSFTFSNDSYPILYPANAATALLSGTTMVYCTGTTNTFVITSGAAALTPATTYLWNFAVTGN